MLVVVLDAKTTGDAERCLGTMLCGLDDEFSFVCADPISACRRQLPLGGPVSAGWWCVSRDAFVTLA